MSDPQRIIILQVGLFIIEVTWDGHRKTRNQILLIHFLLSQSNVGLLPLGRFRALREEQTDGTHPHTGTSGRMVPQRATTLHNNPQLRRQTFMCSSSSSSKL